MAIYNLGTLEQPKQETNPYMEMLMKFGLQSALTGQETKGRKEMATAQGEAEAKTFLARRELEQTDATRKNLTATWQSLSDKPMNERSLFVETDYGKEYLKTAKKYLPELFDDNGNPIFFPSTKDQIKQELDSKINVVKNKLLTSGPDSLNEGERAVLQMDGYKDEISEVTSDLYRNPEFLFLLEDPNRKNEATGKTNAQTAQDMVKAAITQRKALRQPVGINDLSSTLYPSATPIAQEATPKATRFKVKRL